MKTFTLLAACVALALTVDTALAGAINGPKGAVHVVEARSTDSFNVTFRGGEAATVIVVGDGDTDLDLRVYDENGNLVASDTDSTDRCVARWVPRWSGTFRITVQNLGSVYNRYEIQTN